MVTWSVTSWSRYVAHIDIVVFHQLRLEHNGRYTVASRSSMKNCLAAVDLHRHIQLPESRDAVTCRHDKDRLWRHVPTDDARRRSIQYSIHAARDLRHRRLHDWRGSTEPWQTTVIAVVFVPDFYTTRRHSFASSSLYRHGQGRAHVNGARFCHVNTSPRTDTMRTDRRATRYRLPKALRIYFRRLGFRNMAQHVVCART